MEQYSVLMSVYQKDNPSYFHDAIQSMVQQTLRPDDFVIVCDGPLTEELDAVIESFLRKEPELFQVIRQPKNMGLGPALNRGLQQCKHEFVARMDADDIALPDRVAHLMKGYQECPEASVVGGQIAEFAGTTDNIVSYRIVPRTQKEILERLPSRNPMNHVTVLLRRSHVMAAGSYEDAPGFEDYRLWIRMLSEGCQMYNVAELCCYVRVSDAMYRRRGGVDYLRGIWEMERLLLSRKMVSPLKFLVNVMIRFAAAVLVNNKIRKTVYKKLLRSDKEYTAEVREQV